MHKGVVDVWDGSTFDAELATHLDQSAELICNYFISGDRLWREREAQTLRGPMPSNPFGAAYYELLDELTPVLHARTIRGWHHTRMTDDEVSNLMTSGIVPATLADVCDRLSRRVAAGDLSRGQADQLLAASPFQGVRAETRVGRFWLTAEPQEIDDGGATLLLGKWGGESISFSHLDGALAETLGRIGSGRVVEVAVPISATPDAFSAAKAVVATLGRAHGAPADDASFDLYTTEPLSKSAVMRVHTEGEDDYALLGRGYPGRFRSRHDDV